MTMPFKGIIPPVLTPFDRRGNYDAGAMAVLLNRLIEQGVHGVFVVGSAGEFYALHPEEIQDVIRTTVQIVDGRVPVLAGTGAITTRDTVDLSRYAESVGVNGLSVITPFYVQLNDDELYVHYAAIANAVGIPILAYTNPGRAGGMTISPALMSRLANEFPNVIGLKDSSGSLPILMEHQRLCPSDFALFTGLDTLIFDAVVNECAGAVPGLANLVPDVAVSIYTHTRAGRLTEARIAQRLFASLRAAYSLGSFPAVLKAAAEMMGQPVGSPRLPIQPLSGDARQQLRLILVNTLGEQAVADSPS